jgi:hypothetical protein
MTLFVIQPPVTNVTETSETCCARGKDKCPLHHHADSVDWVETVKFLVVM